ncbi:MAG: AraC family transcriptional regulator [Gammaproteobacteria bacterium]|nr:AraC family transcriptional regulator [Gammaproteobacteria bacterium]
MVSERLFLSTPDLNGLLLAMQIEALQMTECLVGKGWRLSFPAAKYPAIHYNLRGEGAMFVGEHAPIPLRPHVLVVTPPGQAYRIEVPAQGTASNSLRTVNAQPLHNDNAGLLNKYVAAANEYEVEMICGYFRASFGASIDIFTASAPPFSDAFDSSAQVAAQLRNVVDEIRNHTVGMEAMATAILKQVVITVLRRKLMSPDGKLSGLSALSDPMIARVIAEIVARPGGQHSIASLADIACLSRAAFNARFKKAVGHSPMSALREVRMERAAKQLIANVLSIEHIARGVGYANRSSFSRAFLEVYGMDPSSYRSQDLRSTS